MFLLHNCIAITIVIAIQLCNKNIFYSWEVMQNWKCNECQLLQTDFNLEREHYNGTFEKFRDWQSQPPGKACCLLHLKPLLYCLSY